MSSGAFRARREPRWPASVAVVAALLLYEVLPERLILGPHWVIPALEIVIGALLGALNPYRSTREEAHVRLLAIALIAIVSFGNGSSVALLVYHLVNGTFVGAAGASQGKQLVEA
jgi:hypothetical protein